MRVRQGCGCPLSLLGLFNFVMVIASILSLARGSSGSIITGSAKTAGAVLFLVIFAGNALACGIIALAAFRGEHTQGANRTNGVDEGTEDADEGTDSSEP